uniref:Uncharacterized protein n=1 Tax=viral metagenome TaxID=1070528 RepID=A0A6C0JRQ0_9ZZZZ
MTCIFVSEDYKPVFDNCSCEETGYTYKLYEESTDNNEKRYAFEENLTCLSEDEQRILWRGTSILALIDSIKNNPGEYNIRDTNDLIEKLSELAYLDFALDGKIYNDNIIQ